MEEVRLVGTQVNKMLATKQASALYKPAHESGLNCSSQFPLLDSMRERTVS
jgi:hypothetical protein